jgi:hypothetical protein
MWISVVCAAEKGPAFSSIAIEDDKLVIEIENLEDRNLLLLDKFDLRWGVLKLSVTNEQGENVLIKDDSIDTDWEAWPIDLVHVPAKEKIKRQISVPKEIPIGKCKVSATYEISKKSTFLKWVFTNVNDDENGWHKPLLAKYLWRGKVESKVFDVEIKGNSESKPKIEQNKKP